MIRDRVFRCAICQDSGFATLFSLENAKGEQFRTWMVPEMSAAKSAGFWERIQPATQRCRCSAGVVEQPSRAKAAAGDL